MKIMEENEEEDVKNNPKQTVSQQKNMQSKFHSRKKKS